MLSVREMASVAVTPGGSSFPGGRGGRLPAGGLTGCEVPLAGCENVLLAIVVVVVVVVVGGIRPSCSSSFPSLL